MRMNLVAAAASLIGMAAGAIRGGDDVICVDERRRSREPVNERVHHRVTRYQPKTPRTKYDRDRLEAAGRERDRKNAKRAASYAKGQLNGY